MNARIGGLLLTALLSTFFLFTACDNENVAGTNNETHTKGTLYQANGNVAAGARVRIFAANQAVGDSLPVEQTKADANGQISLKLKRGYYSLLANDTTGRAVFIDSILSNGDKVEFENDTLRPTGTLTGHLRVQPMHSPAIAWVHVLRTNLFANVDSSGAFRIEGVPEGKLEVVALSHLPEYTPTFRKAQAFSDSTVDIGAIDLVYNGLPLVTGLAATYDTLTGVVTLTWKDTAYARKNGYVVYRGQGRLPTPVSNGMGSLGTNGAIGSTTASTYSDTVFGSFGTTPSRYDSAELDLTYWVAAQSSDYSTGPVWNKAILHVKSPALAKRWKVEWQTTSNVLAETGTVLDTLAEGLGLLKRTDTVATLRIARKDGVSDTARFSVPKELEGGPVFWNGKLWMAKGFAVSSTQHDIWKIGDSFDTVATWRMFDSARILSSPDGVHWDSTSIATTNDSVNGFELRVSDKGLILVGLYYREYMGAGHQAIIINAMESSTGNLWSPLSANRMFLASVNYPNHLWMDRSRSLTIQNTGDGEVWSLYNDVPHSGSTWLILGESADTSDNAMKIQGSASLKASSRILAIGQGGKLNLAFPDSPALWQRLAPPEPATSFCFWRDQLVVLGKTGLHFATITPNQ